MQYEVHLPVKTREARELFNVVKIAVLPNHDSPHIMYEHDNITSLAGWEDFLRRNPTVIIVSGSSQFRHSVFFERVRESQKYVAKFKKDTYNKRLFEDRVRFDQQGFLFYKPVETID